MKTTTLKMPVSLREQMDRLGPWTTRFHVHGQACGGDYEVSQDDSLLRSFCERLPLANRVLELGCMEGGRTFPLARRAGQVLAIDVRREHLERARFMQRKLGISNATFFEADLETCDLQTLGPFDAVYNIGLLYHLGDPARVFLTAFAGSSGRLHLSQTKRTTFRMLGIGIKRKGCSVLPHHAVSPVITEVQQHAQQRDASRQRLTCLVLYRGQTPAAAPP